MLARIRKATQEKDQGFTLIELLVVMIIIGILAAIAIPVFLNQRAKARDTATKADVSNAGKEIAAYYVDGTANITPTVGGQTLTLTSADATAVVITVNLSNGTALGTGSTITAAAWCIGLTNPNGSATKAWKYNNTAGLVAGSCP